MTKGSRKMRDPWSLGGNDNQTQTGQAPTHPMAHGLLELLSDSSCRSGGAQNRYSPNRCLSTDCSAVMVAEMKLGRGPGNIFINIVSALSREALRM
jgi:hypothetical protein